MTCDQGPGLGVVALDGPNTLDALDALGALDTLDTLDALDALPEVAGIARGLAGASVGGEDPLGSGSGRATERAKEGERGQQLLQVYAKLRRTRPSRGIVEQSSLPGTVLAGRGWQSGVSGSVGGWCRRGQRRRRVETVETWRRNRR